MKTIFKSIVLFTILISALNGNAQEYPSDNNYFQLSPRVGYDFPTYKNNTPYIDYNGGIDLGLSLDYYWNWFGLGFDFDYIKNQPESTYPTANISGVNGIITDFNLTEDGIDRLFFGLGPNIQIRSNSGRFKTEFNTRIGLASIKGGRTLLEGTDTTVSPSMTQLLNFHAGYDAKSVLSFKGQVRFTYYLTPNFGLNIGAYYMDHFGVEENNESGISAGYRPFNEDGGSLFLNDVLELREQPCNCDISSLGVFAGLTLRFKPKKSINNNNCGITVTAKDKISGQVIPNTDVILTDLDGNTIESGTTNDYGVVVFNDIKQDNYIIKGQLLSVNLEESSISKSDFKDCSKSNSGIQKELLYDDERFILRGNVVECNTPNGIANVDILLKDKLNARQKNSLSDSEGKFMFYLRQTSDFELSGTKDGYYSNKVDISTKSYDRNNTLFIEFEMCVNECGEIELTDINFDLDKWDILPSAIPELQRIVGIMNDNPKVKVEMSSHTDSQGKDDYNKWLSQNRADATVEYLVNQGISRNRLIAKGMGETQLKNTKCKNDVPCTDEEHRINRRTEFKVLCF